RRRNSASPLQGTGGRRRGPTGGFGGPPPPPKAPFPPSPRGPPGGGGGGGATPGAAPRGWGPRGGGRTLLRVSVLLRHSLFLLLGPAGGLAADRLPRLKLLIAIDLFLSACAALLALMAASGVTNVAAYLAIAALIGAANAFEMPVRQTLVRVIVEERALVT